MALLPVADALARVLADAAAAAGRDACRSTTRSAACSPQDLAALRTQPPADVSAMDGYAVRAADVAQRAGDAQGRSAKSPPAIRSTARSAPAKPRASSPAA